MKRTSFFIIFLWLSMFVSAHVHGVVLDEHGSPLVGANLRWLNTSAGTTTDTAGVFSIEKVHTTHTLITSYIGYRSDTTDVESSSQYTIVLFPDNEQLDAVTIAARRADVLRSRTSTLSVQTLTSSELCKAACCNLSESFETSAAVDVAYADAATGVKQIRLLGLAGTYVQLLTENTPSIRGLAQSFGMEYVPGPWMEAIQVSKGTASVVNGYESTTGQINIEYLKPSTQDPIAVNAMLNTELHAELNATGGWLLTPTKEQNPQSTEVSTGVLAHAQLAPMNMDMNGDMFVDMPSGYNVNILNRWDIFHKDYTGRILVRGLYDRRFAGQRVDNMFADQTWPTESPSPYRIDLATRRIEGFMKNGYVIDSDRCMSIGIITAGSYHSEDNQYGRRLWHATEANAHLNALFQTDFGEEHKLTAGLSLNHDTYHETVDNVYFTATHPLSGTFIPIEGIDLSRRQTDLGVFAEYDYKPSESFSFLVGMRADLTMRQYFQDHDANKYYDGNADTKTHYRLLPTPRLNLRYAPFEWWTVRASLGMGYRTPNVVSDNAQYLPSSRTLGGLSDISTSMMAPLMDFQSLFSPNIESALNAGLTTTFYIPIADKELQLTAEYYYTHFFDCLIADVETANSLRLLSLSDIPQGKVYSHTAQVEASMEILRGWTMTLAYRQSDSRQTVFSPSLGEFVVREKPLQNRFKALITTSYQTPLKKWQFDLTAQFNGPGRMPESFQIPAESDQYFTRQVTEMLPSGHTATSTQVFHRWYPQLLAQITKYWRTCSVYVGGENLTNFTQKSPIIGASSPFSSAFDASQVWAPINGWKIYVGFRYNLQKTE